MCLDRFDERGMHPKLTGKIGTSELSSHCEGDHHSRNTEANIDMEWKVNYNNSISHSAYHYALPNSYTSTFIWHHIAPTLIQVN